MIPRRERLEYPVADPSTKHAEEVTVTATPSEPEQSARAANTEKRYEVTHADLPLACPMPDMGAAPCSSGA